MAVCSLGIRPAAAPPWSRLGLTWDAGPVADLNTIENVQRSALAALAVIDALELGEASRTLCEEMRDRITDDCENCRLLLPTLTTARRKRAPACVYKYREPERGFEAWCHEVAFSRSGSLLALHCSDLQGPPLASHIRCLEPLDVQRLLRDLTTDVKGEPRPWLRPSSTIG